MLLPISDGDSGTFSLLVLGAFAAIVGRYFVMNKKIKRGTSVSLWDTNLPHDKREALFTAVTYAKPSNINKFDELCVRYVALPSKIVGFVVSALVTMLHNKLEKEGDKMKILVVLTLIIIGGIGINGTRHGNIQMDRIFRCLFGLGFIGLLHYLGKVSDMMIIKSITSI